jgi:uncharacterized membrane protein
MVHQNAFPQENVGPLERGASVAAGVGLLMLALRTKSWRRALAVGLAGAPLIYRGLTGYCSAYAALGVSTAQRPQWLPHRERRPAPRELQIQESITVDAPPQDVYRFWGDFENLPLVMDWLLHVERIEEDRLRWTAKGLLGTTIAWDAEITDERENELLAWRSLPDSEIEADGTVHFRTAPGGRRTEVRVTLGFNPSRSELELTLVNSLGQDPAGSLRQSLQRMKELLEKQTPSAGQTPEAAAAKPLSGGLERQQLFEEFGT